MKLPPAAEGHERRESVPFFPGEDPELELKVTMLNINSGKNPELLDNCRQLKEYTIFVERIKQYTKDMDIRSAIDLAVDACIREGILSEFLSNQRAEVISMFLTEYDEEKHMAAERKEHYALGLEDGLARGREESITKFIETLQELHQPQDVITEKLEEKFSLSEEACRKYLEASAVSQPHPMKTDTPS